MESPINSYLDHYCERVDPNLWGEPFNVISNLAFLAVAVFIMHALNRTRLSANTTYWDLWLLSGLIVAIGTGSIIWHLFATGWALWADRIPILLFISVFFISCLIRIFKLTLLSTVLFFLAFQLANIGIQLLLPTGTLNGSIFYLPTLALLTVITVILWRKNYAPIKTYFITASFLFTLGIIFRSIDLVVCDRLTVGTHFVWHLLVAATIYQLMLGTISYYKNSSDNEK